MTEQRITSATLSHGMAKYYSDQVAEKNSPETLIKLFKMKLMKCATVKRVQEAIKGELKHTVIIEKIYREKGSRAKAIWVFLVALNDQTWNMVVVLLNKSQLNLKQTSVFISGHTFARMIQRTTHEMNIKPIITLLTPHLLSMHCHLMMKEESIPDEEISITTYHHLGKVMWTWDGNFKMLAKTWVDASQFHLDDQKILEQLTEGGTMLIIEGHEVGYHISQKSFDNLLSKELT